MSAFRGKRELAYATSVGCPYACNYCTDMVFYKRRFNAYSAEHVVAELTGLVTRYRITQWRCSTPTFPSICNAQSRLPGAYVDSGVKFSWTFQASTDFLCRMSAGRGSAACRQRRIAHGLWHRVDLTSPCSS